MSIKTVSIRLWLCGLLDIHTCSGKKKKVDDVNGQLVEYRKSLQKQLLAREV
jgi:hypothetical protein